MSNNFCVALVAPRTTRQIDRLRATGETDSLQRRARALILNIGPILSTTARTAVQIKRTACRKVDGLRSPAIVDLRVVVSTAAATAGQCDRAATVDGDDLCIAAAELRNGNAAAIAP